MNVTSIGNPICRLAECPLWNDSEKALYWTDIPARQLWRYDPHGGKISLVWQGDLIVGGFAFNRDDDIVMCTHKGLCKLVRRTGQLDRLLDVPMADDERFNDITTDPRGRILAGTLTDRRVEGILYVLEPGKEPRAILRDIRTSNGMTFSLDRRFFYHTDSRARTITRYDYDLDSGDIAHPHVVYRGQEENGSPDGITMDADGFIWIACYRAGKVIRIDSQGQIVHELPVPAAQSSSLIFGGDDLKDLFITSASEGATDPARGLDDQAHYLGGHIFRTHPGPTGRKEWLTTW